MCHVEVEWRHSPVPIPALRDGIVVAWDYNQPAEELIPNAGRSLTERHFLLLDVGVKIVRPSWWGHVDRDTWYVDLVTVERQNHFYKVRDLYIDLVVPTDGRPYRTLDLEEFADAIEAGKVDVATAIDGLRRWQTFLDKYIHMVGKIDTTTTWSNFPPNKIEYLASLPGEAFVPVPTG